MPANPVETRSATIIEPRRGLFHLGLGEVWRYRDLGYFFVWRDIKVRYKQTVIGALWAVVQPLILMVIFAFVFGRVGGGRLRPPPQVPSAVFYFSALLPWTYFSRAFQASTASVLNAQTVIKKVYFPRMILPVAAALPALLDLIMSLATLLVLMVVFDVDLTLRLFAIVPLTLIAVLTALGLGTWLAATNALYRDVREGIPFFIQVLLFTSPVVIPRAAVPESIRSLYGLNPMATAIEGTRWAVTGVGSFPWDYAIPGLVALAVLLVTAPIFFARVEDVIVDVV